MEALFTRYFWIVKTLGIAAAAGLAASAVSTQLGSSFVLVSSDDKEASGDTDGDAESDEDKDPLDPTRPKTPTPPRVGSSRASKDRASDQVRKFNVFCPSCVPAVPEGPNGEPLSAAGPTTPVFDADGRPIGPVIQPGEVRSNLPMRLQATMESDDPMLSLATVYDAETGAVGLYGVDDVVRAGVVVTGIEQGMLHVRNNAALEYLEIGGAIPEPTAAPAVKEEPKEDAPKDDRTIPGAEDAINCPNENLCIVERAFVESLLANPMMLAKQARIVPAKDGEVGFKFYGIRRGSLPKLIGLKNGDKLVAVNGEDLVGMDQAMGLYTKLRRASNLQVTIERKGKSINKEIQIQ